MAIVVQEAVPDIPTGDDMLQRLMEFFVVGTKGMITKIQLVKFLYLADLYSVKWTGQQLTELDWRYYTYGPWDEGIDRLIDGMGEGVITVEYVGSAHMLRPGAEARNPEELGFPPSLLMMLENIRRQWAGIENDNVDRLLDYVYQTEPMKAVAGEDKADRVPLNLELERDRLLAELDR